MAYIKPIDQQTLGAISGATGQAAMRNFGQAVGQARERVSKKEERDAKAERQARLDKEASADRKLQRRVMEANLSTAEVKQQMTQQKMLGDFGMSMLGRVQAAEQGQVDPAQIQAIWTNSRNALPPRLQGMVPEQVPPSQAIQSGMASSGKLIKFLSAKGKTDQESFGNFEKIPGMDMYGQKSSKTGKFTNVKPAPGSTGAAGAGSSEYERGLDYALKQGLIDKKEYNKRRVDRLDSLTGIDAKASLIERKRKAGYEETKGLRKEYSAGATHFKDMSNSIDAALVAMKSGDTAVSDNMLTQLMSQIANPKVRAFQMYKEFDGSYGNVIGRLQNSVMRFIDGKRTPEELDGIRKSLTYFRDNYTNKSLKGMRDRYRMMAAQSGKDPFKVVPPTSLQDLRDSPYGTEDEKLELMRLMAPKAFE